MKTELKTFAFDSHQLRIETDDDGEPLFHAQDLCVILGYTNPREALAKHVDTEDVTKRDTLTAGGKQQVNYLREPGLWSLIMRSNAKNAKPVQRWVVAEVLPSIRKTGSYGFPEFLKPITEPIEIEDFEWRYQVISDALKNLKNATVTMKFTGAELLAGKCFEK